MICMIILNITFIQIDTIRHNFNYNKAIYVHFQDGRKLGYGPMHGIPMVATSPVRHDSPVGPGMIGSTDIQSYEPPWKALSDFALHTDLDRLNPNTPHFQHLVNQVRHRFCYINF